MSECVFCDIAAGTAPATILCRDALCLVFMDRQPVNAGHLLVVPIGHATYLADLPPDTGAQLFRVAQQFSTALRCSGIRCEGTNLILADGEAAGQDVFHVHLHVIPRFAGDGFGLRHGPTYGVRPPRAELERIAQLIRQFA